MIHQYKLGGYNIVLDICSGSVHVVDDVAAAIIARFEDTEREVLLSDIAGQYPELSSEDIAGCYEQVQGLKEAGKLFTPDTYEPMAGQLKAKTAGVVKALCLHIAHTGSNFLAHNAFHTLIGEYGFLIQEFLIHIPNIHGREEFPKQDKGRS